MKMVSSFVNSPNILTDIVDMFEELGFDNTYRWKALSIGTGVTVVAKLAVILSYRHLTVLSLMKMAWIGVGGYWMVWFGSYNLQFMVLAIQMVIVLRRRSQEEDSDGSEQ